MFHLLIASNLICILTVLIFNFTEFHKSIKKMSILFILDVLLSGWNAI